MNGEIDVHTIPLPKLESGGRGWVGKSWVSSYSHVPHVESGGWEDLPGYIHHPCPLHCVRIQDGCDS